MLERVWRKGNPLHCRWKCKLVQTLWRTVWRFFKKLRIELPYDPAIPLLGIHTMKIRTERDTCTHVFTAALFTIARTWKQPICPSISRQTDKEVVVHIHNGILLCYENENIWVRSNEVDETGAYNVEWSKSEREKQILHTNAYVWI